MSIKLKDHTLTSRSVSAISMLDEIGRKRTVSVIFVKIDGQRRMIYNAARGFIFTSDGYYLQTSDGYIIKCQDQ